MSNLEKFIRENRSAFDAESPRRDMWADIEQQLPRRAEAKIIPLRQMLRIAAAAVLLLGIGASAGIYLTSNPASPMVQTQQAQLPLEFVEVESYFQQQYREKLNQLASYQLEPGFQQDQQQFEQVMTELKQELAKAPEESRERIIASMIQNYHTKLDILQRLFEQLQSGNLNIENSEQNENLSL